MAREPGPAEPMAPCAPEFRLETGCGLGVLAEPAKLRRELVDWSAARENAPAAAASTSGKVNAIRMVRVDAIMRLRLQDSGQSRKRGLAPSQQPCAEQCVFDRFARNPWHAQRRFADAGRT